MALLAFVMCMSFMACSSDDDNTPADSNTLTGTTWKIISIDNGDPDLLNIITTFNSDGTVKFIPNQGWNYARWDLSGNTLKIIVGEQTADDMLEGTISINGNSATFDCYWADADGNWTEKDEPHMILHLQKQ